MTNTTNTETAGREICLPTVAELMAHLRNVAAFIEGEPTIDGVDVRLQADEEGWSFHEGDAQYDTDHRGYWGTSTVNRGDTDGDLQLHAEAMIEQVEDDCACDSSY